jgi:hypothetical protein
LVRDLLTGPYVASASYNLAAEPLDFIRGHITKPFVERFARFELLAIDQQGSRSRQPIAVLIVIAE